MLEYAVARGLPLPEGCGFLFHSSANARTPQALSFTLESSRPYVESDMGLAPIITYLKGMVLVSLHYLTLNLLSGQDWNLHSRVLVTD